MQAAMLAPAVCLVLWSLLVLIWLALARFPALARLGIRITEVAPGARGQSLEDVLPDRVMWISHNYTHLVEQPTLFYPTVIALAILGASPLDLVLAWAYVGLRIAHSLWQGLVNRLPLRLALFTASSTVLIALAVRALLAVLRAA